MPLTGFSLGIVGYAIIALVLVLVIRKQVYVIPTLILAPVVGAIVAGFSPQQIGTFTADGLGNIVEVAALFAFAVWYFGIMRDYGLFDPVIKRVVVSVSQRPALLTFGTVALAIVSHLDGAGATTMLVTIPAMLPLYVALDVDKKILACLVTAAAGTMNMVPWGGVVLRGVSSIGPATITNVYNPMIPSQIAGLLAIFVLAYYFSRRVSNSTADTQLQDPESIIEDALDGREGNADRQWYLNVLLTVLVITVLISGITSPALAFMMGLVLALSINVRSYDGQREILEEHADEVVVYVGILFAAGVLLGILNGSKMITQMAQILIQILPNSVGSYLPVLVGFFSVPASFLFSPDSYYFGVLPVLAETASNFGYSPVTIVRASIVGQFTVGAFVSPLTGATFLVIGLSEVELGEHIRFTTPYLWAISLIVLVTSVLTGAIPL